MTIFRLILFFTLARLLFAAVLPLGIDESYMVAAGRGALSFGYFDHPPLSWWMSRLAADLLGSEAAIVVRLPFIALFALTSWLMGRVGEEIGGKIGGARAGFWAVLVLNLSPVFGVTSGSWVLPDGPLDCALLGATLCLILALREGAWRWWLAAGGCFGLALLAKYTAVLNAAGLVLFLLLSRDGRRWFARPQLYAAGLLALLVFSPVIAWNAGNGFASLAFQGGRAAAAVLRPWAPLVVLGGEALFLLPWIWAGLMLVLWQGLRSAASEARLLACMALPAIVLFAVVAIWSRQVLFHWAAPGYLMLYPLLGLWLSRWNWAERAARLSACLVGALALLVAIIVHLPLTLPKDPLLQARTWSDLQAAVADHDLPVAALSWAEAGKVGVGVGPGHPVVVLNADAREFLFRPKPALGSDVLIIAPKGLADIHTRFDERFASIEELRRLTISTTEFGIFLARGVKSWPY